jgi:hypothetical protein
VRARRCALTDEPVEVAVLDAAAPFDGPCVSRLVRDGMVGLEDTNQGSAFAQDATKGIKPDDVVWMPNLLPFSAKSGANCG